MRNYILNILCGLIVLLGVPVVHAQQVPLGNLYNSNEYLINTAESAVDTIPVIFLSYRKQWSGVPGLPSSEKTPQTAMINGHTHITKNSSIGFKVYSDNLGAINQTFGMGSYAHRFIFNSHTNFAIGLDAGIYQNSISYDNVIVEDPNDPILLAGNSRGTAYESAVSFMFVYDHYKIGLSVPRVLAGNLGGSGSNYTLDRHILGYTRFHYDINPEWKLEPSVLYKIYPKNFTQNQYDFNLDLMYKDLFVVGGGYRTKEGVLLRGSVKRNRLQISYSYEFFQSSFTAFSKGSHEIRLGFYFGRKPVEPVEPLAEKEVYHFKHLPTQDEILMNVAIGDSILSGDLKKLSDEMGLSIATQEEDRSYIIKVPSDDPNQSVRLFKLKSLSDLRSFVKEVNAAPDGLNVDDILDGSKILLDFEFGRKFETLKPQDEILLSIKNEDPNLHADLKTLTDRDDVDLLLTKDGYVLDIGEEGAKRRYVFASLKEMNEFMLKLKEGDPGLSGDLIQTIDNDDMLKSFEDKSYRFKRLEKFDEPLTNLKNRSPRLTADLKELLSNRDDVILVEEPDGSYSFIMGDSGSLDQRRFKFATLNQLSEFMQKLKSSDPNLYDDPLKAIDGDPALEMYEDKKYVFKELKKSNQFILNLGEEDPTLSQNLLDLTDGRDDIIISKDPYDRYQVQLIGKNDEKKDFKFETLSELNEFVLRLKGMNPGLDDNLLDLSDGAGIDTENGEFTEEDLEVIHELLYFQLGKHTMTSMAKKNVDAKIELLKNKPFKKIIIAGYTCNLGSEEMNKKLSKARAQRIANYFISQGVPAEKIEVYGKGPEYPIAPNDLETNRRKNRRVEFEIYF